MKRFLLVLLVVAGVCATHAEETRVMPAKRREQIVAVAKSLFEPEVRTSLKVGKVKSPFGVTTMPIKK